MNDRYATTRKAAARPMATSSALGGTYDGAELKTRSSRPGAYDAFAIPSLMFGKQERPVVVEPAHAPSPTVMPASTPRTPRAAKGTPGIYRPQPGSVGDQVISHLQMHGGTLTARQIVELCGVERESVAGLLQRARATGAVAHEIRDRKGYYFLPGSSTVTEAAAPPAEPIAPPMQSVEPSIDAQAQSLNALAVSTASTLR